MTMEWRGRPAPPTASARRSGASSGGDSFPRNIFDRVARMQATGSTVASAAQDPQWKRSGTRAKMQSVADLPALLTARG